MIDDIMKIRYLHAMKRFEEVSVQNPITHELVSKLFVKRSADSYKGSCGKLWVCAGSKGLTGAAVMACQSALRCGCGLISLGCPESLNTIFEIRLTEVMTVPLDDCNGILSYDAYSKIISKSSESDAVLIGPGIGRSDDITDIVCGLIKECTVPLVIDADGLYALSHNTDILKKAKSHIILTPHAGEFSRLTGKDTKYILNNRTQLASEFASKYNVTLVLKSHRTVVASPDGSVYENLLGGPAMATGGTGDVLSGAIASFAAQSKDTTACALAGVYIHSLAADMATLETGEYSLIPSDIIEYIKYAVRETSYRS